MKVNNKRAASALLAAVMVCWIINQVIAADPPANRKLLGQKCAMKGTSTSGGCSGSPTGTGESAHCPGSKTITEYQNCSECKGGEVTDCCLSLGTPGNCSKRNTVVPCVIQEGRCVEGPANAPGGWNTTPEDKCDDCP